MVTVLTCVVSVMLILLVFYVRSVLGDAFVVGAIVMGGSILIAILIIAIFSHYATRVQQARGDEFRTQVDLHKAGAQYRAADSRDVASSASLSRQMLVSQQRMLQQQPMSNSMAWGGQSPYGDGAMWPDESAQAARWEDDDDFVAR